MAKKNAVKKAVKKAPVKKAAAKKVVKKAPGIPAQAPAPIPVAGVVLPQDAIEVVGQPALHDLPGVITSRSIETSRPQRLDTRNVKETAETSSTQTQLQKTQSVDVSPKTRLQELGEWWGIINETVADAFEIPEEDRVRIPPASNPFLVWMVSAFEKSGARFGNSPTDQDDDTAAGGSGDGGPPSSPDSGRVADALLKQSGLTEPPSPAEQQSDPSSPETTAELLRPARPVKGQRSPIVTKPTGETKSSSSQSQLVETVVSLSREDLSFALAAIARELGVPVAQLSNGFRGTASEVQLQAVACVRQLDNDPRILRTLLQFLLARSLARLEAEKSGKPEDYVDAIVACLAAAGDRLTFTFDYRRLIAQLRKTLGKQEERLRNDGFYLTWSVLADLLSRHDDRSGERHAVVYYHEVLCQQIKNLMQSPPGTPPSSAMKERTRVGANNMAAYIGRLLRDNDGMDASVRESAMGMRRKLSRLATACSISVLNYKPDQRIRAAAAVTRLCYGPTRTAERFPETAVVAIDELMRNPMTGAGAPKWEYLQWAFNEAAASLSRLAIPERAEDASGSFFNSGVSLLRLSGALKEGAADNAGNLWSAYVRVLVNGLGMWWALNDVSDWEEALTTRDGLDCAVNFFGAVVDSRIDEPPTPEQEPIIAAARESLGGIVRTLFACRDYQDTARFARDYTAWPRLQSSSRHLKFNPQAGERQRPGMPVGLQQLVQDFLLHFLRLHQEVEKNNASVWPTDDPLLATGTMLHHAFYHLWQVEIREPDEAVENWVKVPLRLIEQCQDLALAAGDLREAFKGSYSECYDHTLPDDAPGQKLGPLVACGLEDQEKWLALQQFAWGLTDAEGGAKLPPDQPLSVSLESNSYDWLPG